MGISAARGSAYQPWLAVAGVAFLLHFAWEKLQAPSCADMSEARHWPEVLRYARAMVGDVVITLALRGIV